MSLTKHFALKIAGCIIGSALIAVSAQAQDNLSGGSGGFTVGFKQYNPDAYNHFLEDEAGNISENLITIGGGGYGLYKNWIVGGYGFFRGGENQDAQLSTPGGNTRYDYSLRGGGGYFTVGYALFSSESVLVFPRLGVGYEALSLEKSVDRDVAYEDNQLLSSDYTWASPMLDIGIGTDFFPSDKYGLKVGLRVGYQVSTSRGNNWIHEGGEITGAELPDNNLDGFYINLTIGGGRLFQDKEE